MTTVDKWHCKYCQVINNLQFVRHSTQATCRINNCGIINKNDNNKNCLHSRVSIVKLVS